MIKHIQKNPWLITSVQWKYYYEGVAFPLRNNFRNKGWDRKNDVGELVTSKYLLRTLTLGQILEGQMISHLLSNNEIYQYIAEAAAITFPSVFYVGNHLILTHSVSLQNGWGIMLADLRKLTVYTEGQIH